MYNDPAAGESPRGPIRPDDGAAPGPDTGRPLRPSTPTVWPTPGCAHSCGSSRTANGSGHRSRRPIRPTAARRCASPCRSRSASRSSSACRAATSTARAISVARLDVAADQAGPHAPGRTHRQRDPGDGRCPGDLHGRLPAVARLRAGQRRRGPDRRRTDPGAVGRRPRRDRDRATDPRPDTRTDAGPDVATPRRPTSADRHARTDDDPAAESPRPSRPRRRRPSHRRPSRPPAAMRC